MQVKLPDECHSCAKKEPRLSYGNRVVDHTGAGNAYCGGLTVGFVISDNIQGALCRAAVSASFALEQFGAIYNLKNIKKRAGDRLKNYRGEMRSLN